MASPGEFHYWRNRDRRWARAVRRLGRWLLGFDLEPHPDVVKTIAAMYYDADPVAEAFVDEVYLGQNARRGRELFEQALAGGIDSVPNAPASLVALMSDIEADPPWVDHCQVEAGARTFRRLGTRVFQFAGAITLAGYLESSVAKPLTLTGMYQGGSARHRFLETVAFWIAVSEPGGLLAGGEGRAAALRVRIMHVFVRRKLLAHPEWNAKEWGVPISQGDALLTLLGGSFAPGIAMRAMGFRVSAGEIRALMHFWRYVGHLMGVRPRWYPSSLREAYQLAYVTAVKSAGRAVDDGRALSSSYVRMFKPGDERGLARARAHWNHGIHLGYARFFTPPWVYRRFRLDPAGPWALHPLAQFPFIFALETLRRKSTWLDTALDQRTRRKRQQWYRVRSGGRPATYDPVDPLTR